MITICKNAAAEVERTAKSVTAQTYQNLDWTVVDGGSTDGTLDLLEPYAARIGTLVSEPDGGIADAFNKGVALSRGDALLFLNAGDHFAASGSLERMVGAWDRGKYRWLVAGGEARDASGKVLYRRMPPERFDEGFYRFGCRVFHPSALVDRRLFDELGPFDPAFRISMDYEFWLRLVARGLRPQPLPLVTSVFYLGGASGDRRQRFREDAMARGKWDLGNPRGVDAALFASAALKDRVAGRLSAPFLFRIKERLGI